MAVFLHRIFHPREVTPEGEIIEAHNTYEKVVGELEELRADYVPVRLNGDTKDEVTVLLDRSKGEPWLAPFKGSSGEDFYIGPSKLDETGLVVSFCGHGPEKHPVTGAQPRGGRSWVRSRLLTIIPGTLPPQVLDHCEHNAETECKGDGFGGPCPAVAA